jgi:hypothetical protein
MLHVLADVVGDDNSRPFDFGGCEPDAELEKSIVTLGELDGRMTEVDVFLSLGRCVAVECKLAERHVGKCSRPRLDPADPFHCDGSYTNQHGRAARCSLAEADILYWQFIPELFRWDGSADVKQCPLRHTYQLVRNVLAACVLDGRVDAHNGVAVLLCDARNLAFSHGEGFWAYEQVRCALLNPLTVCRITWQDILASMRKHQELNWLTTQLQLKYGL